MSVLFVFVRLCLFVSGCLRYAFCLCIDFDCFCVFANALACSFVFVRLLAYCCWLLLVAVVLVVVVVVGFPLRVVVFVVFCCLCLVLFVVLCCV